MSDLPQEYLLFFVIATILVIALIWWFILAARKTKVQRDERAAAEEGAKRNQALIDAPAAAVGPVSAAANSDKVAAAPAIADAEAGAAVPAREAMREVPAEIAKTPAPAQTTVETSGDDLRRIKGLGPKLVTMLADMGVTSFAQIAAWDDAEIDRVDAGLGRFQGRIRRDNWVEQAKLLAADDIAGYEARFGNL